MSANDRNSPDDRQLEEELRRLIPSSMKHDFRDELTRDYARIAENRQPQKRRNWLIPAVGAACVLAMATWVVLESNRSGSEDQAIRPSDFVASPQPAEPPLADSAPHSNQNSGFQPVTSQGYLLNASSRGITESQDGLEEKFDLEFQDIDHWHNPSTATDIRIFSPRRETIVIPVPTY